MFGELASLNHCLLNQSESRAATWQFFREYFQFYCRVTPKLLNVAYFHKILQIFPMKKKKTDQNRSVYIF